MIYYVILILVSNKKLNIYLKLLKVFSVTSLTKI